MHTRLTDRLHPRLRQGREASEHPPVPRTLLQRLQVQSVWERLTGQETRLQRALSASETARGNLQVSQATNQLLGVLAEQQASLQQIVAASGRAEASLLATQAAQEAAARANAGHFMQDFTSMAPVQGVGIPPFR